MFFDWNYFQVAAWPMSLMLIADLTPMFGMVVEFIILVKLMPIKCNLTTALDF